MKYNILINSIIIIISLLITVIIVELILKSLDKKSINLSLVPKVDRYDANLGFAYLPNQRWNQTNDEWSVYYTTNSLGLRDNEILKKKENENRILVLGDSQMFGLGVDSLNVTSEKLELLLNDNSNEFYNVINASIPGAGTDYLYAYLKHYGIRLDADYLVVGF